MLPVGLLEAVALAVRVSAGVAEALAVRVRDREGDATPDSDAEGVRVWVREGPVGLPVKVRVGISEALCVRDRVGVRLCEAERDREEDGGEGVRSPVTDEVPVAEGLTVQRPEALPEPLREREPLDVGVGGVAVQRAVGLAVRDPEGDGETVGVGLQVRVPVVVAEETEGLRDAVARLADAVRRAEGEAVPVAVRLLCDRDHEPDADAEGCEGVAVPAALGERVREAEDEPVTVTVRVGAHDRDRVRVVVGVGVREEDGERDAEDGCEGLLLRVAEHERVELDPGVGDVVGVRVRVPEGERSRVRDGVGVAGDTVGLMGPVAVAEVGVSESVRVEGLGVCDGLSGLRDGLRDWDVREAEGGAVEVALGDRERDRDGFGVDDAVGEWVRVRDGVDVGVGGLCVGASDGVRLAVRERERVPEVEKERVGACVGVPLRLREAVEREGLGLQVAVPVPERGVAVSVRDSETVAVAVGVALRARVGVPEGDAEQVVVQLERDREADGVGPGRVGVSETDTETDVCVAVAVGLAGEGERLPVGVALGLPVGVADEDPEAVGVPVRQGVALRDRVDGEGVAVAVRVGERV